MFLRSWQERRLRRHLRCVIAEHHLAVYRALLFSPQGSLEEEIAEFLLEQAGWSYDQFINLMVDGAFDA